MNATAEITALPAKAARMLAVEILLADPEALGGGPRRRRPRKLPLPAAREAEDAMSGQDAAARLARLEAWVEVVMRTLATLGMEGLLTELDEARGADYSDMYLPPVETPARRATPVPSPARDDPGRCTGRARRPAPDLWCRAWPFPARAVAPWRRSRACPAPP
jgi:hypothetical protein